MHLADRHGVAGLGEDLARSCPAAGAGTSASTLSVEISTIVSSTSTRVAGLLGPLEDRRPRRPTRPSPASRCRRPRRRLGPCRRLRAPRRAPPGRLRRVGAISAEHGADVDRVALRGDVCMSSSGHGRRHFGVDLVGRDLDQRLVFRDLVTFLLAPFQDGALGNRVTHRGHGDLDARGACGHPASTVAPAPLAASLGGEDHPQRCRGGPRRDRRSRRGAARARDLQRGARAQRGPDRAVRAALPPRRPRPVRAARGLGRPLRRCAPPGAASIDVRTVDREAAQRLAAGQLPDVEAVRDEARDAVASFCACSCWWCSPSGSRPG